MCSELALLIKSHYHYQQNLNSLVCPREVDEGGGVDPGDVAGHVQVRGVSRRRPSWQDPNGGGWGCENTEMISTFTTIVWKNEMSKILRYVGI